MSRTKTQLLFGTLCQSNPQPNQASKSKGRSSDHCHSNETFFFHFCLNYIFQVLSLTVTWLNLKQPSNKLQSYLIFFYSGISNRKVIQIVTFACLIFILEKMDRRQVSLRRTTYLPFTHVFPWEIIQDSCFKAYLIKIF